MDFKALFAEHIITDRSSHAENSFSALVVVNPSADAEQSTSNGTHPATCSSVIEATSNGATEAHCNTHTTAHCEGVAKKYDNSSTVAPAAKGLGTHGNVRPPAELSQTRQNHQRSLYYVALFVGVYIFFFVPYTGCTLYQGLTGSELCLTRKFSEYVGWSPYFQWRRQPIARHFHSERLPSSIEKNL
jgi:hypothetical protein